MSVKNITLLFIAVAACISFYSFTDLISDSETNHFVSDSAKIERGKYIVESFGCAFCHTPKKMSDRGPVIDESKWLMGHPSESALPPIKKSTVLSGGWTYSSMDHTAHVGPWGISYSANITSDESGIGAWSLEHFTKSLKQGKHKGLENSRPVMPPMPWTDYVNLSDEDVEAIFLYLKSTEPIRNIVPAYTPIDQIQ